MRNRLFGEADTRPFKLNSRVLAIVMLTLTLIGLALWMVLWPLGS